MKKMKFVAVLLSVSLLFSGCNWTNLGKGAAIGGGAGAAVGAGVGALVGGNNKGAAAGIGAAIGAAVGSGVGMLIGKKMDDAAKKAAEIEGAEVEAVTDVNGLQAVKVTFESGILFAFNSSTLSTASKESLKEFSNILLENPTMNVDIYGHTDKVGTEAANLKVSQQRADAVAKYLKSCGVPENQMIEIKGLGYSEYNEALSADENRRVEIYLFASQAMIEDAENGTLL